MKQPFATVAIGTDEERMIAIKNFTSILHKSGKIVKVLELENDEGYILQVQNPPSSELSTNQEMWLTKKSFSIISLALGVMSSSCGSLSEESLMNLHEECEFYGSESVMDHVTKQ